MTERSFVMQPALEIAGDWVHPSSQEKMKCINTKIDPGMWKVGVFSFAYKFRM